MPTLIERIYWTPIAADERPNVDILLSIDGVKYNYLKAVYDSDVEYYSCERNDYRMADIEPSETQACMTLKHAWPCSPGRAMKCCQNVSKF